MQHIAGGRRPRSEAGPDSSERRRPAGCRAGGPSGGAYCLDSDLITAEVVSRPGIDTPELLPLLLPRVLVVQRFDEEHGLLDVGDERIAGVDRRPADFVTVRDILRVHTVGAINDEVDLALVQIGPNVRLALHVWLEEGDHRRNATFLEEFGRILRRVQAEAHLNELQRRLLELHLLLERTDREEHGLRRELEMRRKKALEVCFVLISAETRNLAGRLHLDSQA